MAKSKDKKKKDSVSKKTKEVNVVKEIKAGRGRPTKDKSKKAVDKKEPVKVEKASKPKKVLKPITKKEKVVVSETKPKEKKINETDLLIKEIYGDEPYKDAIIFPNSEQKTQTTSMVKEFGVDVHRLPQEILSLVDDFISCFTKIVENPMLVGGLINELLEKDTKASNALTAWIEPRKEKLTILKVKTTGGVMVTQENNNDSNKVVINSDNVDSIESGMPTTNQTEIIPPTQPHTPPPITHGTNPITPRENNGGTYQHTIQNNPVSNAGKEENKNIHYEVLAKNNHFKDVHIQQNPTQNNPESPIIIPPSPEEYLKSYANSLMSMINNTFQIIHWGYIPMDVLKGILDGADKSFGYEVVRGSDVGYINISKGENNISTPKFKIQ